MSATGPLVMKVLVPLSRQPPSTRSARVRMLITSEPASGSVIARQPISEPSIRPGSQRSFCSALPWRAIRPTTMSAWCSTVAAVERQTAASSSPIRQSSVRPRPAPPSSWRHRGAEQPEVGRFGPALGREGLLRRRSRGPAGRPSPGRTGAACGADALLVVEAVVRLSAAAPSGPPEPRLALLEERVRALEPVLRGEQRGEPRFGALVRLADRQQGVGAQGVDARRGSRAAPPWRSSRPARRASAST